MEDEARILHDAPLALGEGATYFPQTDTAWWFDIVGRKLLEHRFADATTTVHDLPFMASEEDEKGKPQKYAAGAIYHVLGGEIRTLYPGLTIPNCISFTQDGRTAYFTDTKEGLLYRVATDPATGLPSGERSVVYDRRWEEGGLDGAVVGADGVIWVAIYGGGCVEAFSPEGTRLRAIAVPAGQPTCPAFVGPAADRLMVTTASQGLDAEALAADPHAGKTFLLDAEVKGWHAPALVIG